MSVAKWATPGAGSGNIASTLLNSLANAGNSARIAYDNSTNRDLYCRVEVILGSITPATGGSITVRVLERFGSTDEGITTSLDSYTKTLTPGASAKNVIFGRVPLSPFAGGFVLTNSSGVTLAASGNSFVVIPYNEEIV